MGTGRRCRGVAAAAAVVFGGAVEVVSTIQTSFEVALLGYNGKALAKTLARLLKTLTRVLKTLARVSI